MNSNLFDYPNKLNKIFDKLEYLNIRPIIVGGYVRDTLLGIPSKDIDIELYGVGSFEILEDILSEFGEINSVGKSFAVCKLVFEGLELDFSLPRQDSKVSVGHKGFEILVDNTLDFTTATSRRDFTINAIGYDVKEKKLLDPFEGKKDIQEKQLKAVSTKKFTEDPLRVLRGIGFSSRLGFTLESKLLALFHTLIEQDILQELPTERIYEELKKMLLKSLSPSVGLHLLHELKLLEFFGFSQSYEEVDYFALHKTSDEDTNLLIFLALLYTKETLYKLGVITNKQKLLKNLELFLEVQEQFNIQDISNYTLYKLASKLNIEIFLTYINASYAGKQTTQINKLKQKAKKLHILNTKLPPLIQGKKLIAFGLSPSKKFSDILEQAYEAQMKEEFSTLTDATAWIQNNLF